MKIPGHSGSVMGNVGKADDRTAIFWTHRNGNGAYGGVFDGGE